MISTKFQDHMSVTLKDIIDNTAAASLDSEVLKQFCKSEGLTFEQFAVQFAQRITHDYMNSRSSWLECDCAMNGLYSYSVAVRGTPLDGYALAVFRAFDEAEYRHAGDPENFDPESRTKKLLSENASH
jgi:hypothetical protein